MLDYHEESAQDYKDYKRRDLENTDLINNWIEDSIKEAAIQLNNNISKIDIRDYLLQKDIATDNICLIMKAAQILHNDRIMVPIKKSLFWRV